MLKLSTKIVLTVAGMALVSAPVAVLAAQAKAGLWQITVLVSGGNAHLPDLSKLPPEVLARMKAMGVGIGGNSVTVQHCMSAQEFALHKLPYMGSHAKGCAMSNYNETGNHVSFDLACSGKSSATGHVQADWDSDEHYTAEVNMTGTQNGQTVSSSEKLEGRLISVSCGSAGQ
jgi:hypothetical protein